MKEFTVGYSLNDKNYQSTVQAHDEFGARMGCSKK